MLPKLTSQVKKLQNLMLTIMPRIGLFALTQHVSKSSVRYVIQHLITLAAPVVKMKNSRILKNVAIVRMS